MQKKLKIEKLNASLLWALAPIFFSKQFSKEVGEPPVFDFSNEITVYYIEVEGAIVSFSINQYNGRINDWLYDFTVPEYRGMRMNDECFIARNKDSKGPSTITVRDYRVESLYKYGLTIHKQRGQWVTMIRP